MSEISVKVSRRSGRKFIFAYYDDPVSGKRVERSTKCTSMRDAERFAGNWERELLEGLYQPKSKLSWEAFQVRVEQEMFPTLAVKTQGALLSAFGHLPKIAPGEDVGRLRLASIDAPMLSRLQNLLRKDGLKETSIACHLRHIRWALSWAVKQKLLNKVPDITFPKISNDDGVKGSPISLAEFQRMIDACESVRPEACWPKMLWGLWYSGLRLGEAMSLSWDRSAPMSVDLTGEFPRLRILASAQKSRKSEFLPLTPDFAEWMLATDPIDRYGLVFPVPAEGGKPFTLSRVSKIFSAIGKKADVVVGDDGEKKKYASAHDMRRSFGSRWAMKVKPALLQKLMRHASITTTMKYYVRIDSDDIARELREIEGIGTSIGTT